MLSNRTARFSFPLGLMILVGGAASAQGLVRDINQQVPNFLPSSNASSYVELGGQVLFRGAAGDFGTELLVSDGTAPGTGLLVDVLAGEAGSFPTGLTVVGSQLFFSATSGATGQELWVSDGTAAGTHLVDDLSPGVVNSSPSYLVEFGGLLYFRARNNVSGYELWSSDGTAAGTSIVVDLNPLSANVEDLTVVGGQLFFTADDGVHGREPWVSDGTAGGTLMLADLAVGGGDSNPDQFVDLGGQLYFVAQAGGLGRELWTSDGTPAGTLLVKDIGDGISSGVEGLTVVGSELFFAATDPSFDRELWKSDGTAAGTVQVADIHPTNDSNPEDLHAAGGLLFFTANDGTHGRELWVSDGTAVGTTLVDDLAPGLASIAVGEAVELGGELLMALNDGALGLELWKSDGTALGTQLLGDFFAGSGSGSPNSLAKIGSQVWFTAYGDGIGREPHVTDGTAGGTGLVKDVLFEPTTESSLPLLYTKVGGRLILTANDGTRGVEVWASDGTEAGTIALADLAPGSESSYPSQFTPFRDRVVFVADNDSVFTNYELHITDGTPLGTELLADLAPGIGSDPGDLYATSELLYFSARTVPEGREPWTWDGVNPPQLLLDIHETGSSNPKEFFQLGDAVYFQAYDPVRGAELWKTDGSTAGTALLKDIDPGVGGSDPSDFTSVGDLVFFVADSPGGEELWKTDGTSAGTVVVKDLWPTGFGAQPENLTPSGDQLFFTAFPGGLYVTDGTFLGTVDLPALDAEELTAFQGGVLAYGDSSITFSSGTPGGTVELFSGQLDPDDVTVAGDVAYFTVIDPPFSLVASETQLWKTDGTVAGTELVLDLDPDDLVTWTINPDIRAVSATGQGREILFAGYDLEGGAELWRSDGTAAGTERLADLREGFGSSHPAAFRRVGNSVFFIANDGASGKELFAVPFDQTGAYTYEPFGQSCVAASSGLAPAIGASGAATLGNSFQVEVTDTAPGSAALLYFSLSTNPIALGGCTFYLGAPFFYVSGVLTDGSGLGSITVPLPNGPALLGTPLYAQFLISDSGGPVAGIATLSDALEVIAGP